MNLSLIDDADRFAAMRAEWNALLADSDASGPFLTWEWLHAWWTHLGGAAALRLAVVRDGSTLVAVTPLLVSRGSFGWLSRLEFLGTGGAGSDYLDVIARRGLEREAAAAIARGLETQNLTIHLRNLRPGATALQLPEQLSQTHWTLNQSASGVCPVIALAGHTWDSYLATLGSNHRANVRRRIRGLEKQFDVRFDRVAAEPDRDACLRALIAFHAGRFTDRGGSSAFASPALYGFHDDATRRLLSAGWLRMYTLRLDGVITACMYGFLFDGRFYFYQHGFDAACQQHSVGLVLMALAIRSAIEEGAREFDMLWGTEPYKWLWAREARALTAIDLFPAHIGGAVQRGRVEARRGVRRLVHMLAGESRAT